MAILVEFDEVELSAEGLTPEDGARGLTSPAQNLRRLSRSLIASLMAGWQDIATAGVVMRFPCVGWPSGIFELSGQRWEFLPLACFVQHTKEIQ